MLSAMQLEQLTELKVVSHPVMLDCICCLWKATAEQHGWGDKSAHFVWKMYQEAEWRWCGHVCYLTLGCPIVTGKRGL